MSRPQVILEPHARRYLRRGFNQLADLLAATLGPCGRTVALTRENPRRAPELLNDGALIARRFLGLPNRFETMGAFLARHLAWQVEEAVGDGSTTAVVIARAILNEAERYLAAGYNAMRLRIGIEKAAAAVLVELHRLARPLDDPARIAALGTTITGDEALGRFIEEIFDVVGPHGMVDVRNSYALTHDREYIRGAFWNQGWVSSYFVTEAGKAVVDKPYILFTSRHLAHADELLPIMEKIHSQTRKRGFVVIANGIAGDALNLLVTNKTRQIMPTLAIKAPGLGLEKSDVLQDLAILCGGRVFLAEAGDDMTQATLDDLGQADEVQAIRSGCTIIGGKGRPAALRARVADLRSQLAKAPYGRDRDRLLERAGKLTGGVALLNIGGVTELERDYMKGRAKEAVHVVRLALEEGIVPGGGAAYLDCLPALECLHLPEDEAAAVPIMRYALQAPLRAIVQNAGVEPAPILARMAEAGPGTGYDLLNDRVTDMCAANIVDPLRVLSYALRAGVSGALMAMTTDALVHKPRHTRDDDVDLKP